MKTIFFFTQITTSIGRVVILALDPIIWSFSLPHRTQIIYPPDASMIVGQLDLVPGSRVLEAGTGSGALTHALAQAVWPNGRVSTFDFHEERVKRAREEFEVRSCYQFALEIAKCLPYFSPIYRLILRLCFIHNVIIGPYSLTLSS